jgi:hypothetical protein
MAITSISGPDVMPPAFSPEPLRNHERPPQETPPPRSNTEQPENNRGNTIDTYA